MKYKVKTLALACAITAASSHAEISLNGFASVVAGQTTEKDASALGYSDSIDFKPDSLFALQASSDLGEGLSVTAQIISRGRDDWEPKFEWAYVAYEATDNFRVLAGRQRVPFYMYSDFLDVSYAYNWITPPQGVYNVIFDTFDGLGGIYNFQLGEFDNTLHVVYGRNTDKQTILGNEVQPDFKHLVGGALTLTRDWLTLRAAYFQAEVNMPIKDLDDLAAGWDQAGFADIANHVRASEDDSKFVELGVQVDYEQFVVIGEYTKLTIDNTPFANEESYYVLGGYRHNEFLASITYGKDEDTRDNFVAGVPSGLDPSLDYLKNTTEDFIESQQVKSNYYTVGLRWDFHDSAAFKFEFTGYTDKLRENQDANVIRTAIVTVF